MQASWLEEVQMDGSGEDDTQRNREIAKNEAERRTAGAVRVSGWTVVFAVIIGVIALAVVRAWLNR